MEMQLEERRPLDLPVRSSGAIGMEPIHSSPGVDGPLSGAVGPTGKGRGGHSAGLLDALQPTESGPGPLEDARCTTRWGTAKDDGTGWSTTE